MQWRRQKKVTRVIGSSNHVLLLARYQDAPPGEEDEEEGLRKDYVKSQEKETNAHTHFERNGQQSGYKPRRAGTSTSGGSTSGYASSGSRSHRDESAGSPSQPKIIFNEEEYTRITTPRQDVLFKKGYLSRKKPWTGNASTSATPSTTESQSASHSTADGSETTEDQQLLDRDSGTAEYPPVVEPGAQLGYGTFYDHASGYYYEYPVMLVGPAPVPAQVGPSVLATVPCGPVPLRPIEWINPAFVPKLANQPYCLMDYQTNQSTEPVTIVEEQNGTIVTAEASNNVWNESGTGSASCSGSVAEEIEEQPEEANNATMEQHVVKEQLAEEQPLEQLHLDGQQHLENGMTTVDPYLDPLLMQEPVHMSHMMPAVPQPYMYPGHYMFGPPLVNVNGVTIQGGPLVRTMDVTAMTMACAKRRKKKKKRKQRRPTLGNTEDEEEGEYSSECDNDVSSSRLPWSECPTSTATATTTAANRPLNPECQEFQLRPDLQSRIPFGPVSTSIVTTVAEEVTSSSVTDARDVSSYVETESASRETETCDSSTAQSLTNQEEMAICNSEQIVRKTSLENIQLVAVGHTPRSRNTEINGQANHLVVNVEAIMTNETTEIRSSAPTDVAPSRTDTMENDGDSTSANVKHELFENNSSDVNTDILSNRVRHHQESLTNGDTNYEHLADLTERASKSRSVSPQNNGSNLTTININEKDEIQRLRHCNNSSVTRATSLGLPRKYKKGLKFVRESTPGPDLDDSAHLDVENKMLIQQFEAVELSDADCKCSIVNDKLGETEQKVANKEDASEICNEDTIKATSRVTVEGSNEDSGFESQTRVSEKYPVTAAVKEWLRRANSPDLFVTSGSTSESETDEDDDEEMDVKPPKNLQGNPMPALSANSGVDNVTLSRTASCGEFAKTNNNNINARNDEMETDSASIGRRKRDAKVVKRKTKAKRNDKRNKNVDEKTQSQLVSSLVSLDFVTGVRSRDKPKNNVGDVCEFTQEDSVAGMRVALSSRINSKRVNVKRMKTLRKISKNPVENIDIKMRRIDNLNVEEGKETSEGSMVSVRTFEKGEIIVSEDGRLLPTSSYEPVPFNDHDNPVAKNAAYIDVINKNVEMREKTSSENDENDSVMIASSVSIEEPDVLECWEAETVEPVITPRRMLQTPGVLCEGEAAEDDNIEIERANVEHVQRYYRLARDTVNTEEESSEFSTSVISSKSRTVPNDPEDKTIGYFRGEEIPIFIPDKNQDITIGNEKIPIDEAFEAYESCYTGKSPFLSFDTKMFRQRPLYGQNGEGPIPSRAVCCNIQ
ncbi:uncharacterized protein LOC112464225 isoform X1 [Temnothorax curvispinosus]|uniref:Uncharacterized protein LOC112464225 isoform X1 n=1 Tax=Temnothorax curvispinosus TaxID=300111 RepID=A0A6J1R190_9HYME|nr:uncharacterized protein LOC112464225 isoform X1 [Temnothorax curvispinosus]XP_024886869.1 uncharacterized protein LOC112464225 isoform X1 [Temnothorax curvispinosus]